jgi:hypothetical protein
MFLATSLLSLAALSRNVEIQINKFLDIPECLDCVGILSVYRICAASCLLHLLLSLLMVGVESSQDSRSKLQNGYWAVKIVLWCAFLGGSMYMPNGIFIGIGKYLFMPGAFLFILVQVVVTALILGHITDRFCL